MAQHFDLVIVGTGVAASINISALAVRHNLTAALVKEPLYAYPTRGSGIEYMV